MAAKSRTTINLDDAEYQELFALSLAWLGRRALCDLAEKYSQTETHHTFHFSDKNRESCAQ